MRHIVLGEILIAGLGSLLISIFLGPKFIEWLRIKEFGQHIREEGPEAHHLTKAGTPTMGGVMIIGSVLISTLFWANLKNWYIWIAIVGMVGCAVVGFADDYIKIVKKRSLGLTGRPLALARVPGGTGHLMQATSSARRGALVIEMQPTKRL